MPHSQMSCDLFHPLYVDNESRFRSMGALQFEDIDVAFKIKTTVGNYSYSQWQPTDVIDGQYRTMAYNTTPPQSVDSTPSQFFPPAALTAQPPSPPQPTINSDETNYFFLPSFDSDCTIQLTDENFEIDNQFVKHQVYGMDVNTPIVSQGDLPNLLPEPAPGATPSTMPQEVDRDTPNEVKLEQGVERPRRSSKTSKKSATPGVPPPKGNNPWGSKGTRTCAACRKRKGKVTTPRAHGGPLRGADVGVIV